MAIEFIFALGLAAIFYAYAGYPLILWILSFFIKAPTKRAHIKPSVTLVISAYNEERVLSKKLENALELDYSHLLEIAVISDGSTDNTNHIIQEFAGLSKRIVPYISQENKGKTACLNDVVPTLAGDIILFSDANSFYDKNLIRSIVRPFADPDIGFVTGSTAYSTPSENVPDHAMGIYSRLERLTKSLESDIGSCVGADGAVFAIRKSLFSPLRTDDINDLVTPFHILSKGYRGVLEASVVCTEASLRGKGEFQRQIRIANRTLNAIFSYKTLLNPFKYPLFSFMLFSHKLMKYLTPFCLFALLITNLFLIPDGPLFYRFILFLQLLFYTLALLGFWHTKTIQKIRIVALCHVFFHVNVAYLIGWVTCLKGETYISWIPER
ncbi:MAG: glycosyltransferase family 2 protein [Deltaproteobacteria bacterium]|nr:glycosyltransferase family 2 protein [Deltaproteobacteria bacterium]